ncbi:hypothetical protein RF11_12561 [Thelohanellus kitauei]|uniref:Uncharacterized protein n=1 Tax=Thelohanellus kitauei TaxID=669202 RepID=A0A0C2JF51_THEKT|nr:hypothetical protein RF11_12561 [Thelohanellus kitauei]
MFKTFTDNKNSNNLEQAVDLRTSEDVLTFFKVELTQFFQSVAEISSLSKLHFQIHDIERNNCSFMVKRTIVTEKTEPSKPKSKARKTLPRKVTLPKSQKTLTQFMNFGKKTKGGPVEKPPDKILTKEQCPEYLFDNLHLYPLNQIESFLLKLCITGHLDAVYKIFNKLKR